MKDPTAKAAERNVEGGQRAAYLVYRNEDGQVERLWLDLDTLAQFGHLVGNFTDDDGNRHVRFKKETLALLEQREGRAPTKGEET